MGMFSLALIIAILLTISADTINRMNALALAQFQGQAPLTLVTLEKSVGGNPLAIFRLRVGNREATGLCKKDNGYTIACKPFQFD